MTKQKFITEQQEGLALILKSENKKYGFSDPYGDKPLKQPIHATLKPQAKPERFELTWNTIRYLSSDHVYVEEQDSALRVSSRHLAFLDEMRNRAATALEIILQCRTFSPGLFERVNGKWQRAGSESKHENLEGC